MDYRYVDYTTASPNTSGLPKVGSTYKSSFTRKEYDQTASETFRTVRVFERTRNPQSNLGWGSTYNDTAFVEYSTYSGIAVASSTFDIENEYNNETFTGLTRFNYERTGVGSGTSVFRMSSYTTDTNGGGYTIWDTEAETYEDLRFDRVNDRSTFISTYKGTSADFYTSYFTRTYPLINYFYDMWGGVTSFDVVSAESTDLIISFNNTFNVTLTKQESFLKFGETGLRNKTYTSFSLASYETVTITRTRSVQTIIESNWQQNNGGNPMVESYIRHFETLVPVSTEEEVEVTNIKAYLDKNSVYKTSQISGKELVPSQGYENLMTSSLSTRMALTGNGKYYAYGTYVANHDDYWLQPPSDLKYTISDDEWVEVFAKSIVYGAYEGFDEIQIDNIDSDHTISTDTMAYTRTNFSSIAETLNYFTTATSNEKHQVIDKLGGRGDSFIARSTYDNIRLAKSGVSDTEFKILTTSEYIETISDNRMYERLEGAFTHYVGSSINTLNFADGCGLKGKVTAFAQLSLSSFGSIIEEKKGTTFSNRDYGSDYTSDTFSSVKSFIRKPRSSYMDELTDLEIRKLWTKNKEPYVYMPWLQSVHDPYYMRGLYREEMKLKSTIPVMLGHKSILLEEGLGTYSKKYLSMNNVSDQGAFVFEQSTTTPNNDPNKVAKTVKTTSSFFRSSSIDNLAVLRASSTYSVADDNVVGSVKSTSTLYFTTVDSPLITQHERINVYPYGFASVMKIVSNHQQATKRKDDGNYYDTANATALKNISVFTGQRKIEAINFVPMIEDKDSNFDDTVNTTIISHNMNSWQDGKSFDAEWGEFSVTYMPDTSTDWGASQVQKGVFSTRVKPVNIRQNREIYFEVNDGEYATVYGHTNLRPEVVTTTIYPLHSKMPYVEGQMYAMPFYTDDVLWEADGNVYVPRYINTPWVTKNLKDEKTYEVRPELPITESAIRPKYAIFKHFFPKKIFVDKYTYRDKNIRYKIQGAFDFPSGTHAMPVLVKIPKKPKVEIL